MARKSWNIRVLLPALTLVMAACGSQAPTGVGKTPLPTSPHRSHITASPTTAATAPSQGAALSWSAVNTQGNNSPNYVACSSAEHCIALSDTELATTGNAGLSWTFSATPSTTGITGTDISSINCTGSDCIIVGSSSSASEIYVSTDGGNNWKSWATDLPAVANTYTLTDATCPSTSECLAVGSAANGSTGSNASIILATDDSGTTWTATTNFPPNTRYDAVACMTPNDCVAGGVEVPSDSGSVHSLLRSSDRGRTWSADVQLNVMGPGNGSVTSLSCPTAQECTGVGPAETVEQTVGKAPLYPFSVTTSNGGEEWTVHDVDLYSASLYSVTCPSPTRCVAAGIDSGRGVAVVAVSDDSGQTWTLGYPSSASTLPILSISCGSPDFCVTTGGYGNFFEGLAAG